MHVDWMSVGSFSRDIRISAASKHDHGTPLLPPIIDIPINLVQPLLLYDFFSWSLLKLRFQFKPVRVLTADDRSQYKQSAEYKQREDQNNSCALKLNQFICQ